MQEQDYNAGAAKAVHRERGAERRPGGALPGAVQARDGAAAAGEDEPRRGAAPDTRRHQRGETCRGSIIISQGVGFKLRFEVKSSVF